MATIGGCHRAIAEILDHPCDDIAHEILVVDHQHRGRIAERTTVDCCSGVTLAGHSTSKRAPARARETNRSPPPCDAHDAEHRGEAEPVAGRLRREERLEDPPARLAIDAGPVVAERRARRSDPADARDHVVGDRPRAVMRDQRAP